MNQNTIELAHRLGALAAPRKLKITVAESCTGGGLASAITSVAGSSAWFEYGFVTYSNGAKSRLLGVKPQLLLQHGAVSQEVVSAMTEGALKQSGAHLAVAISGIAGPNGSTANKPVGLVWFAWQKVHQTAECLHQVFQGNREQIRAQAVEAALAALCAHIEKSTV